MTTIRSLTGVALYRNNPKSADYLMLGVGETFYTDVDSIWVRLGVTPTTGQPYVDHSDAEFGPDSRLLKIKPLVKGSLKSREAHLTGIRATKPWYAIACPARGFSKSTVSNEDLAGFVRSTVVNCRMDPSSKGKIIVPSFTHTDLTLAVVEGTHALHTLSAADRAALIAHFDQYRFDPIQIAAVLGCSPKTIYTWRRNAEAGPSEDVDVREVIKQALLDAVKWRESLADAHEHMPTECEAALAQAKAYRVVLRQRYGSDKTVLEAALDRANVVSLADVRVTSR